jgi:nucleoside-diphosphate-sugar epimerase
MLKWLGRVFVGLVGIVLALVAFVVISLRADLPPEAARFQPVLRTTASPGNEYLVFGGTRNTGLEVVKLLRQRGDQVTAFVRPSSNRSELEALGVSFAEGDAVNLDDVKTAFAGGNFTAAINTIGCFNCDPPPDYLASKSIAQAAQEAGVKRVVLITTIGVGDSRDAAPWLSNYFLRSIIPLKAQAEDDLRASDLDYTIIRPGGLGKNPATGTGFLSEDRGTMGFVDRAELARLIVGAVDDDRAIRKTFAAVDASKPTPW